MARFDVLTLHPEIKRIVICEIEPRVVGATNQFVKENYSVLTNPRVELVFDAVAVKPGKPLVFGQRGAGLVFGLPGNPVSAQVVFQLFVRTALLAWQGARAPLAREVRARLAAPLRNGSGRRAYLPVTVREEGGELVADPLRSAGSADVVTHARADGLVRLEPDEHEAPAGRRVPLVPLAAFGGEVLG